MIDPHPIRKRFASLCPHLSERERRLFAAAEARAAGYGGIAAVSAVTGIAVSTIGRGLKELTASDTLSSDRCRRPGGGRKLLVEKDATLLQDLLALVEPSERGDPMSPFALDLQEPVAADDRLGRPGPPDRPHGGGRVAAPAEVQPAGQTARPAKADSHPDRDAQFVHINNSVKAALAAGQPVISVDTKKKELVGDFKNAGQAWRPRGEPEEVRVHDFLIKELGRAVPYGVYDLAANTGWVSIGMSCDTAAFAVQTIRRWWAEIGSARYPEATRLVITADGGGSNGSRVRLWKRELQRLADELGLDIAVHHLPPGTSKWNKIEHRLFSFVTMNWKARPLVSYRVIVDLIGATTTDTGLTVRCELDSAEYPKGIVVSDREMDGLNISSGLPSFSERLMQRSSPVSG